MRAVGATFLGNLGKQVCSPRRDGIELAIREQAPAGAPKPKLLDRVRRAIRTRHFSYRTEKAYAGQALTKWG